MLKSNKLIIFLISLPFLMVIIFYSAQWASWI